MAKNAGRKRRWTQDGANAYSSALGKVGYQQDGWYALLDYRTLAPAEAPGGFPVWVPHARRLGPFKRPRDAMVALEREVTFLRNRHGPGVLVGEEVWAER